MEGFRILVVDDDPDMARAIAAVLADARYDCEIVESAGAALSALRQAEFDLVLSDVVMDGLDGFELLGRLKRERPDVPVVLLTGAASIPAAVDAVKRGAFQYLTKPCEAGVLREVVAQAITNGAPSTRGGRLRRAPKGNAMPAGTEELVGSSTAMSQLRAKVELVARAQSPVLVQGETGTGKELVARAIHACSTRRAAPFVSVNASAIPEALLESEMFGHARGAFTGAAQARRGLFAEADGGTLLLDEVGDMPFGLQAKLLRVLQSGEVRPVGSEKTQTVDVRVVAATHRRLADMVREGRFREDLFYRLDVVSIQVPPLRARSEDIPELAVFFLERARRRAPESPARALRSDLIEMLVSAPWPGNVRELESTIERLVVLATSTELTPNDVAERFAETAEGSADPADASLDALIQRHVANVLAKTNGNKARAAKMLGVDLSTLYRWQRKWGT
jgi:two-component system response regulator HydG